MVKETKESARVGLKIVILGILLIAGFLVVIVVQLFPQKFKGTDASTDSVVSVVALDKNGSQIWSYNTLKEYAFKGGKLPSDVIDSDQSYGTALSVYEDGLYTFVVEYESVYVRVSLIEDNPTYSLDYIYKDDMDASPD